jgi:hypothetical protein
METAWCSVLLQAYGKMRSSAIAEPTSNGGRRAEATLRVIAGAQALLAAGQNRLRLIPASIGMCPMSINAIHYWINTKQRIMTLYTQFLKAVRRRRLFRS